MNRFPRCAVVRNLPANAGDTRDECLTLKSGRSAGERNDSILAWEISWTEEPGGLQSMGLQKVGHN